MPRKVTPTYVLLNQVTLAAATGTITFSSIPQNYSDLVLVIAGTGAAQYRLNPNGDSGNASLVYADGYGSSTASGTDSKISLWYSPNSDFIVSVTNIFDYSSIDKHKTILTRANAPSGAVSLYGSRWASTAAITSLVATSSTGTLSTGSTLSLYGIVA